MLVLSRRVGEEIVIDGRIHIAVTSIRRDRVRIGITAPPDVPVHRLELLQRMLESADTLETHEPTPV
jgi:carbon storage regulator